MFSEELEKIWRDLMLVVSTCVQAEDEFVELF